MIKKLGTLGIPLVAMILSILPVYGEPVLDDIPLDNYRLYSTVTIDLTDSIKDPGNEYVIRWYANEEQVNEVYGLFGNQLVTYTYCIEDNVGKQVYATIEAYNTKEIAKTEKRLLESPSGDVSLIQNKDKIVLSISNFDNTSEYDIRWYLDDKEITNDSDIYMVKPEDIGRSMYCIVRSLNTNHYVISNKLVVTNPEVKVYIKNSNSTGEWINGISGRWYLRRDGSHPVGEKLDNGDIKYAWEKIDGKWFAFNELGYATDGYICDANDGKTYLTDSIKGLIVN